MVCVWGLLVDIIVSTLLSQYWVWCTSTEAHTEVMTSIEQTADSQWDHLNCYCEHDIAQEVSMLAVMEQVWIVVQSLVFQYYTLSMMMPSYEWLPQTQVSLITNILELLRRVLLNPIQSRSISNNNGEREFTISMLSLNDCTYMYRALAITSWKHVTKHFRMAKKYCAQSQLNRSWCLTHNLCAIFTGSTQRNNCAIATVNVIKT